MSYLSRLSRRVAVSRSLISVALPKGVVPRAPIQRSESALEEDEAVAPLRRTGNAPVRRLEEEPPEEPDVSRMALPLSATGTSRAPGVKPVMRQTDEEGDEELSRIQRQENEEEELAPLRRQETAEEEEELAPLRRMEGEEEEEAMRSSVNPPHSPETGHSPVPGPMSRAPVFRNAAEEVLEPSEEDVPSEAMPLRRDIDPAPVHPVSTVPSAVEARSAALNPAAMLPGNPLTGTPFTDPLTLPDSAPLTSAAEPAQSDVVIEQLDVLIHEPSVPSGNQRQSLSGRNKSMRSRYLRRL